MESTSRFYFLQPENLLREAIGGDAQTGRNFQRNILSVLLLL